MNTSNNILLQQTNIEKILLNNKSFEQTKKEINSEIQNGGNIHEPLNNNGDYIFHILVKCITTHIENNFYKYKNKDIQQKCNYFINQDCDIETSNNDNETPLYSLCVTYTKNIEDKNNMIQFLLECGASINYCYLKFNKKPIIKFLQDDIDMGYNKFYVDKYYRYLIHLLDNYNYIVDCCLYSSLECFRYILRNNMVDINYELLTYATNEIEINNNIEKSCFYNEEVFDYKKTFLYLFNKHNHSTIGANNFKKRNKLILKYIEDSLNIWNPSNHYIKNWYIKDTIHDLLIIKKRLFIKNTFYLPDELWFKIFSFLKFYYY